jgi:SAM-dependent methyltransferase
LKYKTIEDVVYDLEANPIESSGSIYHPIPFPEFSGLKTSTDVTETYRKWRLIKQVLISFFQKDLSSLKILDVGSNAGFFTFSLAKEGANVTAVEPHPRYAAIGQFLSIEKKLPIKWYNIPFNDDIIKGQNFDVSLVLSVFQWMAGEGYSLDKAARNLYSISKNSKCMVFELGYNSGKCCIRTNKLNHYAELIRFLRENTSYSHFMLLGKTKVWRSATRHLVFASNNVQFEDKLWRKVIRTIRL